MFRQKLVYFALTLILIVVSVAAVQSGDIYFQIKKQLTIFSDIYREVAILYVDEVSPENLMQQGIKSMLESLDPYTEFIGEDEQQQMEILSSGNYGGVGIDAGYRGERVVVIAPLEGYPAERSGIRPGDIILKINDTSTQGMTPEDVQQLTIGDVGTRVTLEIERAGIDQPVVFELERERIEVKNISYTERIGDNNEIAYIQLTRFGQNASEELRQNLLTFREAETVRGLILDLRNNPGGLLDEAIRIVDKFIEPGVPVVETRGRLQEQSHVYMTEEPAVFQDLPVVILINNGSASASEVVAGALQDLDRAVILGEKSFGKGLVQTIRPLSYNTSLKLTVSRYYIPSGRSIQAVEYSHENAGTYRAIPESLRTEYETRNGRKVYDGMGIEPDITVLDLNPSLLEIFLMRQNHYFFFINDYISEFPEEERGRIPEDLFDRFTEYLEELNFDYRTSADQMIGELQNSLGQFSDSAKAGDMLQELNDLVQTRKLAVLQESRDEIEQDLRLEWLTRTGGPVDRMKVSLPADRYVQQALSVLSRREIYDSILNPQ